jgi:hypothetical protein
MASVVSGAEILLIIRLVLGPNILMLGASDGQINRPVGKDLRIDGHRLAPCGASAPRRSEPLDFGYDIATPQVGGLNDRNARAA